MVDTAINAFPLENADVSKLYTEKAAGNLVRTSIDKFASSVSGAATGQTFYVDASGNVVKRTIGSNGAIMVASSGLPNWLAPGSSSAVLYANASAAPTWSGTGTDGQTLVLNGVVPTWTTVPAASYSLIQSQTGSAVAAIDFTTGFDSTYDEYVFVLIGVYPSTAGSRIHMRVSVDAGASFIATGYDYACVDSSTSSTASGNEFQLTTVTGPNNTVAASLTGKTSLVLTSVKAGIVGNYAYTTATPTRISGVHGGTITTASRANAVRFLASSGNINGTIRMYGVKNA